MPVTQQLLSESQLASLDDSSRDSPPTGLADELRLKYPTEHEYERMLDRKLRRRNNDTANDDYDLASLTKCLQNLISARLGSGHCVRDARWLTGGASKIQIGFTISQNGSADRSMVLRMEPRESLNSTSRLREAQVIRAISNVVAVPEFHWLDNDAQWFPEPALIYSWVPGTTKPTAATSRIAGIGIAYDRKTRDTLATQFVRNLAAIHTFRDFDSLSAFQNPGTSQQSALWQLNRARRVWDEDRGESMPILGVAAEWLSENLVCLDEVSLVHGDYRGGNFLYDEGSGRITAVLDWERAYLGDRHRDLAWTMLPPFGHYDENNNFLVAGLLPRDEFKRRYVAESGLEIDEQKLAFYRILGCYQSAVTAFGTAYRVAKLGRSHQDVVLTGLESAGYVMLDQIIRDLREVL